MSILELKNVFLHNNENTCLSKKYVYQRSPPYTSKNLCFYSESKPAKDKHHFLSKVRGDLTTESMRSSPTLPHSQKRKAPI